MQNKVAIEDLQKKIKRLQEEMGTVLEEIERLQTVDSSEGSAAEGKVQDTPEHSSSEDQGSGDTQNHVSGEEGEGESIPIIGRTGIFDGIFMITDDDKKFQIPPNYASKSQLVVGDKLEIVDVDETGSKYSFKQVRNVDRREVEGILTKKDNQWAVHTDDGIYYVVAAAVRFHKADVGDVVAIDLPAEDVPLTVEWGAFKEIRKQAMREEYEPRAKQYAKQSSEEEIKPETTNNEKAASGGETKQETSPQIVKSRLSSQQNTPTSGDSKQQESKERQEVQKEEQNPETSTDTKAGEIHVTSSENQGDEQTGEIDLTEEDLWELR